ncbi:MAG: sporulation protein YabP [Bacillota bacterium]|nr:sporulation protein YabP [Bacillota bacterium]
MAEHLVSMSNREKMELTGVKNVLTFDEEEIMLETNMGFLSIQGEDLHITRLSLDDGQVAVEGSVNLVGYKPQGADIKAKGKNILNRLFK